MSRSQYSLVWDSYKSNICSGFSALQQSGEFVDMTLAADGHFVKVHQVMIALSSSYLKNLIASAPCQHPIIFLNNISHKVLCFILEYIYTGEVLVPSEYLNQFTEASKSLHIRGLENIANNNHGTSQRNVSSVEANTITKKRKSTTDTDEHYKLPVTARKVFIKSEGGNHMSITPSMDETEHDSDDFGVDIMDAVAQDSEPEYKPHIPSSKPSETVDIDTVKANPSSLLYTVSIRGSLQVILNRYIYNLNSTKSTKGVRRWRCVDYRNNKCTAFVVTRGNVVLNRANLHNHPFHDKKILGKIEKKAVFSALDEVEAYREKEKTVDREAVMVDEDDHTIDQFKDD